MPYSPQVDNFILIAQPFAHPILNHIRALVHHTCPEAEEKIKWGMPFFDYKGEMMCHMAAFKQHCAMGFWKASLMKDKGLMQHASSESSMGHIGKITCLDDLPSDKKIIAWIKEAMKLNDDGIKVVKVKPTKGANIEVPDYFLKELNQHKAALKTFNDFSYSCKKEYVTWISDAKTISTRNKRMVQAIDWMAEGKKRMWKYEK